MNITGNSIAGQSAANKMNTHAIEVTVAGEGTGNLNISNNGTVGTPITHIAGIVISLSSTGNADVTSVINNNVIVANHGAGGAYGITAGSGQLFGLTDNATLQTTISNNNISATDNSGIFVLAREASSSVVAKVINNTVAAPLSGARPGIRFESGNAAGAQ